MNEALQSFLSGASGAALIAGLFGLIMWLLNRRAASKDKTAEQLAAEKAEIQDVKCGLRMLLYADIKRAGKEYLHRNHITTEELEDLIAMHKIYHDQLGGNGFLDSLMHQVRKLSIDD